MPDDFDGSTAGDDEAPASTGRSEALREAREAEVPDFSEGAEGTKGETESGEAEGTSPEAEAEAPSETVEEPSSEAEGEAEAFLSEVDTSDWDEQDRKDWHQYKGSAREVLKALRETKKLSLSQREEIRRRDAQAAMASERPAPGGPPAAEAAPEKETPSSGAPVLPDTPEVQQLRSTLQGLWQANEEAKKRVTELAGAKRTRASEIEQIKGEIRYIERRAKDPNLPEYEQGVVRNELIEKRQELGGLLQADLNADLELTTISGTREKLADQYDQIDSHLRNLGETFRRQATEKKDRDARRNEIAAREYDKVTRSLNSVVSRYGVPKEREGAFRNKLLQLADGHPTFIENLEGYFDAQARELLDLGRPAGTQPVANYAEQKRKQAIQPAPRGAAAVADQVKGDAPMTRREARALAFRGSRRIPIG